jgi:hypothetical protein
MKKQNILAKIILVIFSVLTLNLNIALSHDCISSNEQKTNCIESVIFYWSTIGK